MSAVLLEAQMWMSDEAGGGGGWPRLGIAGLVGAALLAIGLALPRFLIADGLESFRDDPARREVAARAYQGALLLRSGPLARLLLPVAQVEEVALEPGHCPADGPEADREHAGFTARVRFYTVFALPGPSARATCGGWRWVPGGAGE